MGVEHWSWIGAHAHTLCFCAQNPNLGLELTPHCVAQNPRLFTTKPRDFNARPKIPCPSKNATIYFPSFDLRRMFKLTTKEPNQSAASSRLAQRPQPRATLHRLCSDQRSFCKTT